MSRSAPLPEAPIQNVVRAVDAYNASRVRLGRACDALLSQIKELGTAAHSLRTEAKNRLCYSSGAILPELFEDYSGSDETPRLARGQCVPFRHQAGPFSVSIGRANYPGCKAIKPGGESHSFGIGIAGFEDGRARFFDLSRAFELPDAIMKTGAHASEVVDAITRALREANDALAKEIPAIEAQSRRQSDLAEILEKGL